MLNAMRHYQTTLPVMPFLSLHTLLDWEMEKGLYQFHPDASLSDLWYRVLYHVDDEDRAWRVLRALERDAFHYGTTLHDIASRSMTDTDPNCSFYHMAFRYKPVMFASLCKQTQSPPCLVDSHSSFAVCYHAADFYNVSWAGSENPGMQQRAVCTYSTRG
jgi:hypothetical protein